MKLNKKKTHKKIVRFMRKWNKTLAKDEYIGLNRFRIDLYREIWTNISSTLDVVDLMFKISDNKTGNYAIFIANDFNYKERIMEHTNDFLIRCSKGQYGHFPPLNYVVYDIHEVIKYDGENDTKLDIKDSVIDKYSWI